MPARCADRQHLRKFQVSARCLWSFYPAAPKAGTPAAGVSTVDGLSSGLLNFLLSSYHVCSSYRLDKKYPWGKSSPMKRSGALTPSESLRGFIELALFLSIWIISQYRNSGVAFDMLIEIEPYLLNSKLALERRCVDVMTWSRQFRINYNPRLECGCATRKFSIAPKSDLILVRNRT